MFPAHFLPVPHSQLAPLSAPCPFPAPCPPLAPLTLEVLLAVAAPGLLSVAGVSVVQDLLEALYAQRLVQVLLLLLLPEGR